MKGYDTQHIRNVALLGHGGAGKTTLAEAMAYVTGVIKRQGRVEDGNTISDFDKEENKRLFSIGTSVVPIEFEDIKINVLDTPGYFDFAGEVEEALSVADAAIIVVDGKSGIQVGTQKAWDYCEKYSLPRMIFVTSMDDDKVSFTNVSAALSEAFGTRIAPFQVPIRDGEKFIGFVDLIEMKGRRFTSGSTFEECAIPADVQDDVDTARETLMEAVAETNEEFMERYFGGDTFTLDEIIAALNENVSTCGVVPVLCGTGLNCQGVNMMMRRIKRYFPNPSVHEMKAEKDGEAITVKCDPAAPVSAKVFKTLVDPFIGKYSLIKVCTGKLTSDATLYDLDTDSEERVGKLYVLRGKEAIEVPELVAGDIGALAKLNKVNTGDTLASKGSSVRYAKPNFPVPYTYKRYETPNKADIDKVASGLARLADEDRTIRMVNDSENRQTLLYGIGDQQLDVIASKLEARYKVHIDLDKPRFAFRETIRQKANVTGTHKKQSGGHGQYGVVNIDFEPSGDLETPYIFEERVVGGAVPKNFFPAIEKGIQESVLRGPLAGYPVVGLKATLLDGKYHPVDSSEMAFKTAASLAFKEGVMKAGPVLLEPIATLSVVVPNSYSGDVMGDLNKRRGRILGMDHMDGGKTKVTAEVPMSELYGYSTDLRSMTGGIGDFSYEFTRYEQAPADVQAKEVAARAEENA